LASVQGGTAVIVVHGLDPATLSKTAQGEKSDLVPSLPLAATSPALCGAVTTSQMSTTPTGSSPTGGGSTAGMEDETLFALGGVLLLAAGGVFAARRRTARES
jgi:LPXTG-motif cell wall-anchored protein